VHITRYKYCNMMLSSSLLLLPLLLLLPASAVNPQARDLRIINEAGFKVEIFWINRWKNDELVLNSEEGIFHGAESRINSYLSHEFEVQEVANKKLGKCKGPNDTCRKGHFQVNSNEEQVVIFKEALEEIVHTDNVSTARDLAKNVLQECKASAIQNFDVKDPEASMTQLIDCIDKSVTGAVDAKKDEIEFQQNLRFSLGSKLVSYACVDPNVTMAESIDNTTWVNSGVTYKVKMLLDRPASKIAYIQNFISIEECAAVEAGVTLADVDGASGLYAKKGGMDIQWDDSKNIITTLANRMYAYTADALRVALQGENSEQLFMLHYPGGNAENPSRYDPHCDGKCDGSNHVKNERIATVIAYCETAEKGGHTHFSNAGVHVIPEKGSAVFYSYYDQTTNVHDTGFTKHAGCGVVEGDKKIVTHKVRL